MTRDCKICLMQHDEEIHAATVRVHEWYRAQVTQDLYDGSDNRTSSEEQFGEVQLDAA
jgi:hypothetical protein